MVTLEYIFNVARSCDRTRNYTAECRLVNVIVIIIAERWSDNGSDV